MKKGDKIAIVCCSNGQNIAYKDKIEQLKNILEEIGLIPVFSDYIYAKENGISGSGKERAESLMKFYKDSEIKAIFDISGGDISNELLPYINFDIIAMSTKQFWGYSDLTTLINAIYAKTGKSSVLYQVRNLVYKDSEVQIQNFLNSVLNNKSDLYDIEYSFIQGNKMSGILVGGNIRCLLKLAGTEYWPDTNGKVLLLEAYSGKIPQMITYLSQLKQLGVLKKVNGILLGTFTEMEKEECSPKIQELIKEYVGSNLPIAYTKEIGHGTNSKGIIIGETIELRSDHDEKTSNESNW